MTTKEKASALLDPLAKGCGPLLQMAGTGTTPLRQMVLEYVRAHEQAARADITQALHISPGTATTLTADLIASGQLREIESLHRETSRGRPRVALEVVPEAAYVIGIKLSFNQHTAVLSDFAGNVIADASLRSAGHQRSVPSAVEETAKLVDILLHNAGKPRCTIAAIGIGLPGLIDHASSTVLWSPLLETVEADLAQELATRFDAPILLDNDANMLTLAELWFGKGRAISDFAVVTVESGVGMGLVLNNQLYRGAHGIGLELGHTKVQMDGALCNCGQRGCLEAYLADYALAREAGTALGHRFDPTRSTEDTLSQLFEEAKAGNKAAKAIFTRAGRYLSLALSNVVQLFDPEMVIFSGERVRQDYLYSDEIVRDMQDMTLNSGRRSYPVVLNAWDGLVWARGASALALDAVTATMVSQARVA